MRKIIIKYKYIIILLLIITFVYYDKIKNKIFKYRENFSSQNIIDYKTIDANNSKFQRISIIKFNKNNSNLDKCLVINNEVQLCNFDEYKYHEMMVHFPSTYVKNLKTVLIIGGGDCMTLREVMKYPNIKKVDMLELDKNVVKICKKNFNVDTYENDKRVNIIYGDAAKSIKKLNKKFYDLIIIDTTEDNNNNLSVDSPKFFNNCKKRLNNKGVLVKNGEFFYEPFQEQFKYCNQYGYYSKTFEDYYRFTICSEKINFNKHYIDTKKWNSLKIKTKFYKPNKHEKYFNWYTLIYC